MLRAPSERLNRFGLGALRRELNREGRTLLTRLKRWSKTSSEWKR
jgi:hypothetical protein